MTTVLSNSHSLIVKGFPVDHNSSYQRGCASAPEEIKKAFYSGSSNFCSESEFDLGESEQFKYQDNISFDESQDFIKQLSEPVDEIISAGNRLLSIGGDHSITYPIVDCYAKYYDNISILHFDAHPDLYPDFEGNLYSHASPFARIMEIHSDIQLNQVGIRTINKTQRSQIEKYNVVVIKPDQLDQLNRLQLSEHVYISLDLDAFDPSVAPGVSHYEAGGLLARDAIEIIKNLTQKVIGADIVEYNPGKDHKDMTAHLAVKMLKEIAAKILE